MGTIDSVIHDLTTTQDKTVCRWLADNPTEHGFATELWTVPRLAPLIEQEFGIHFHSDHLTAWLRRRGRTSPLRGTAKRSRNPPR